MTALQTFQRLDAALALECARKPERRNPAVDRERAALFYSEILSSTQLAGATLTLDEVRLVADRDIVPAARPLAHCVLVADYAAAARLVRELPQPRLGQPLLRAEEIVELHARAAWRAPAARPGKWRDQNLPPFPGGMVAPPPWLVPFQIAALIDRFAGGPPPGASPVAWVAQAHERFERLHPFTDANGRAGRLLANLLLRRLDLPSLILPARRSAEYFGALRAADSGDPWPLAVVFARAVLRAQARLNAAGSAIELRPLTDFADGAARAALYKAAQRGRLRSVRRGGRLFTTADWLADYRATRAPAGRPASAR